MLTRIVILARKVLAGKEVLQKHFFIQSCPRGVLELYNQFVVHFMRCLIL